MATGTSGSFTPPNSSAVAFDPTKELGSFVVGIPAATNLPQVVNPAVDQQSFTVFNTSSSFVRGTVTFQAGITATGAAATRAFLVPPAGTYSMDFGSDYVDVAGNIEAIDSIIFVGVTIGTTTAEASTLTAPPTLPALALLVINFGSN